MKEELKIKDVMIGDWVDVRNNAAPNTPHLERITPSHFLRDEYWYGIEIVAEILEKNGFEKQQGYIGSVFAFDDDDKDAHVIIHPKEDNYTRGAYTYIHIEHGCLSLDELPIEYIHELQHALRLCKIDKEINL